MNLKKAKRIRKQLKAIGTDPREAVYKYSDDSVRRSDPFRLTIELIEDCGRKIYKGLKRLNRG